MKQFDAEWERRAAYCMDVAHRQANVKTRCEVWRQTWTAYHAALRAIKKASRQEGFDPATVQWPDQPDMPEFLKNTPPHPDIR